MVLEKIKKPNDIKKLKSAEIPELCEEIRDFLIKSISVTGGHLASNLGVVELTVALHLVFDPLKDRIVWDVGHQSYTHKILTGRMEEFKKLRSYGGISGFPKRSESSCDAFDTGHSSTSISAALGLAQGARLTGEDISVVAVIGDGAMTGGLAFEALNNASRLDSNFIILLNDNEMSISENVGGMSRYLSGIRTADLYRNLKEGVKEGLGKIPGYGDRIVEKISRTKNGLKQLLIPGMYFENMGIIYLGPVDGHDVNAMTKVLREAGRIKGPVLVHVLTKKGKGYLPAERHPSRFHGTEPFEIETGLPRSPKTAPNYTDVFSTVMRKMGDRDEKLVCVTAAMADGTGLKRFRNIFPDRFFDVGIAEEHAVTFAAGLALKGLKPVVAIYSSFLQRAYDQIIHDVCMQGLHVIFAIDRAGIVGSDGETHQGVFDISYLRTIPGITLMAPKNKWELSDMLKFALDFDGPIAVRYPRGQASDCFREQRQAIRLGRSEMLRKGRGIALFAYGSMVKTAEEVGRLLEQDGMEYSLINARFAKPLDTDRLSELAGEHDLIVTMEENALQGGLGEAVQDFVSEGNIDMKVLRIGIPDEFVVHGKPDILKQVLKLDAEAVFQRIKEAAV